MTILANKVSFDTYNMIVELSDGRTITAPLAWFPRLLRASQSQRQAYRIGRRGIHWDEIDEDISVVGLLEGRSDATLRSEMVND